LQNTLLKLLIHSPPLLLLGRFSLKKKKNPNSPSGGLVLVGQVMTREGIFFPLHLRQDKTRPTDFFPFLLSPISPSFQFPKDTRKMHYHNIHRPSNLRTREKCTTTIVVVHFSRVFSISLFGNWKDGEIGDKRKGKKSVDLVLSCRRWSGNIYIIFFCRAILFSDLLCFWPQFSCYSDF